MKLTKAFFHSKNWRKIYIFRLLKFLANRKVEVLLWINTFFFFQKVETIFHESSFYCPYCVIFYVPKTQKLFTPQKQWPEILYCIISLDRECQKLQVNLIYLDNQTYFSAKQPAGFLPAKPELEVLYLKKDTRCLQQAQSFFKGIMEVPFWKSELKKGFSWKW